jgi:hypothetical protein
MPTDNEARIASIRERITKYVAHCKANNLRLPAEDKETAFLLAEYDRVNGELASSRESTAAAAKGYDMKCAELDRVTEERDDADAKRHYNLQWAKELEAELTRVKAAHTWTVATPATMPPVGSGPWLVEAEVGFLWYITATVEPNGIWCISNNGNGISIYDTPTRFAAMPEEADVEANA